MTTSCFCCFVVDVVVAAAAVVVVVVVYFIRSTCQTHFLAIREHQKKTKNDFICRSATFFIDAESA